MNVRTVVPELIGDLNRFGVFADRIEGLVETQVVRYRSGTSDWIVLPWADGFYLFSEDSEGQRRGREVVVAFLGPGVVSVETVPDGRLERALPAAWKHTGLVRASYLRRVDHGKGAPAEMLARLEDMAATFAGRTSHKLEIRATPSDLLRDFRLALLGRDDESASNLLNELRFTGHQSAENLRYLRIEYFAAFDRWSEMRSMPHISPLLQARRPRVVSESLLRMVWWTELVGPEHQNPQASFNERGVLEEFGPLLRSVPAPATAEGRVVCFLTALADNDAERQEAILDRAEQGAERMRLEALRSGMPTSTLQALRQEPSDQPFTAAIVEAYEAGRFADVIAAFLDDARAEYADLAVEAVLDSGAMDHAARVLELVRDLESCAGVALGRRARRDLAELQRLVDDTCAGWLEWAARVSAAARWSDASAVIRDHSASWTPIGSLGSKQVSEVCDALLDATGGLNADQVRSSLDLFCDEAAAILSRGSANDFCQVVLALLSEQDNFSEMVRSAYLEFLAAWLEIGPSVDEYGKMLDQTLDIWKRIASPIAVAWALGVLAAVADRPCPDQARRSAFAVQVVAGARQYDSRLSLRECVEVETFAAELGLPARVIEAQDTERDVWSALDGKVVGIYSLLPNTVGYLRSRLAQLCSVSEIRENHDQVATSALRALADRADYLIVDTWHAAHQATAAIDAVRPRERQILPRQRGRTGFLRALEEALET